MTKREFAKLTKLRSARETARASVSPQHRTLSGCAAGKSSKLPGFRSRMRSLLCSQTP